MEMIFGTLGIFYSVSVERAFKSMYFVINTIIGKYKQ